MAWIGLYNFDDVGTGSVVDRSGNGFHITLPGTAAQISSGGVLDSGALSKTAVGTIPLPSGLVTAAETDDRTIMLDGAAQRSTWWVRAESVSLGVGVWGALSLDGTSMIARARTQANGSPTPPSPTIGAIVTGTRHNYAVTYKRSTGVLSVYYDGVLVTTSTFPAGTALYAGADGWNIAEWGTSGPAMDNLRIATHCADAAEIASLAGTPVSASPHAEGAVTLAVTASATRSGAKTASGSRALSASAALGWSGVRTTLASLQLSASTGFVRAGVAHRGGSMRLAAGAALRIAEAGNTTPASRTFVVPAETRTVVA